MSDRFNIIRQITDPSFNPFESRSFRLAVSLHPTSFSCSVLNPEAASYVTLHHFTWETGSGDPTAMPDALEDDFIAAVLEVIPWLKNPFLETRIAWEGATSTLIPGELYLDGHKDSYLGISFGERPPGHILCDTVEPLSAHHVYSIPGEMIASINDLFRGAAILHTGTLFIRSVIRAYGNRIAHPHLFINLRSRFFDLMVYDGTTMAYYNTFAYLAPEDVVYYIIFVMEQLNLNPDGVPLVLFGNIHAGDELYSLLYKYIRQLTFGVATGGGCCPMVAGTVEEHAYISLYNLFPCGS